MPFTVVPDKNVGDTFTEGMWDTSIKDNLNKGVMRPISDSVLGAGASSFTFSSIAADWVHLMVCIYGRGDFATSTISLSGRFNSDSAANYDQQTLHAGGGFAVVAEELFATTAIFVGTMPAGTAAANLFSTTWVCIPNYQSAFHKMAMSHCSVKWGVAGTQTKVWTASGSWRNTAAITSVTFVPGNGNIVIGSRFTLYGLAV